MRSPGVCATFYCIVIAVYLAFHLEFAICHRHYQSTSSRLQKNTKFEFFASNDRKCRQESLESILAVRPLCTVTNYQDKAPLYNSPPPVDPFDSRELNAPVIVFDFRDPLKHCVRLRPLTRPRFRSRRRRFLLPSQRLSFFGLPSFRVSREALVGLVLFSSLSFLFLSANFPVFFLLFCPAMSSNVTGSVESGRQAFSPDAPPASSLASSMSSSLLSLGLPILQTFSYLWPASKSKPLAPMPDPFLVSFLPEGHLAYPTTTLPCLPDPDFLKLLVSADLNFSSDPAVNLSSSPSLSSPHSSPPPAAYRLQNWYDLSSAYLHAFLHIAFRIVFSPTSLFVTSGVLALLIAPRLFRALASEKLTVQLRTISTNIQAINGIITALADCVLAPFGFSSRLTRYLLFSASFCAPSLVVLGFYTKNLTLTNISIEIGSAWAALQVSFRQYLADHDRMAYWADTLNLFITTVLGPLIDILSKLLTQVAIILTLLGALLLLCMRLRRPSPAPSPVPVMLPPLLRAAHHRTAATSCYRRCPWLHA